MLSIVVIKLPFCSYLWAEKGSTDNHLTILEEPGSVLLLRLSWELFLHVLSTLGVTVQHAQGR